MARMATQGATMACMAAQGARMAGTFAQGARIEKHKESHRFRAPGHGKCKENIEKRIRKIKGLGFILLNSIGFLRKTNGSDFEEEFLQRFAG